MKNFLYIIFFSLLILFACSEEETEETPLSDYLILDNFNRENSENGFIGNMWSLSNLGVGDELFINDSSLYIFKKPENPKLVIWHKSELFERQFLEKIKFNITEGNKDFALILKGAIMGSNETEIDAKLFNDRLLIYSDSGFVSSYQVEIDTLTLDTISNDTFSLDLNKNYFLEMLVDSNFLELSLKDENQNIIKNIRQSYQETKVNVLGLSLYNTKENLKMTIDDFEVLR